MKELRKTFYNPPKGGNEEGVPTTNPMAPVSPSAQPVLGPRWDESLGLRTPPGQPYPGQGAQGPLRAQFNAGATSARISAQQGHQVGPSELRNYQRGLQPVQPAGDPSAVMAYDFERDHVQRPSDAEPGKKTTKPQLHPDTRMSYRTDGKPNPSMGKPNGNPGVQSNTDAHGGRADGQSRDNPAHVIGRNNYMKGDKYC